MANIIDLPDFMFKNVTNKEGKFKKIYLFFKGVLVASLYKLTSKNLFCFFINLIFRKDGKINHEKGYYFKKLSDNSIIRFPNKRIDRVVLDHKAHFKFFLETYCLSKLEIKKNDLIIDCGANVGELYFALRFCDYEFDYIGFEPDPDTYKCLELNLATKSSHSYKVALSNESTRKQFFLDTDGADSSLEFFGRNNSLNIETATLDSFDLEKIKLFKIEAEGHELEVLQGSVSTLKNIEYISVDYGPEKGPNNETTIASVINFLYANNFTIIDGSKHRQVGLFKNKLM